MMLKIAQDTRKTRFCMEITNAQFSFTRCFGSFYGTVKILPQSRGSFYSNKDDCITRLCPRTLRTWFLY